MQSHHGSGHQAAKHVRFGKKTYPVVGSLRVHGRAYLLLRRLSAYPRERFLALDTKAGERGEFRCIYLLPRSESTRQHVAVLRRVSMASDPFPLIIDFDGEGDPIIIVFRWVSGMELSTYMTQVKMGHRPRPTPTEAFKRIHGLAHGLSRQHRRCEIVHGDIKPANLVIERDSGRLVLIDFGTAWASEQTSRRQPGDGHHPVYAAPELQERRPFADFRSDQFSAAVILYEMITLVAPYDGLGGKAGLAAFASEMRSRLVPPSRLSPHFARMPVSIVNRLDGTILRSLALDPDERFPTPSAWLDELDAIRAMIHNPHVFSPRATWLAKTVHWLADRFLNDR